MILGPFLTLFGLQKVLQLIEAFVTQILMLGRFVAMNRRLQRGLDDVGDFMRQHMTAHRSVHHDLRSCGEGGRGDSARYAAQHRIVMQANGSQVISKSVLRDATLRSIFARRPFDEETRESGRRAASRGISATFRSILTCSPRPRYAARRSARPMKRKRNGRLIPLQRFLRPRLLRTNMSNQDLCRDSLPPLRSLPAGCPIRLATCCPKNQRLSSSLPRRPAEQTRLHLFVDG